MQPIVWIAIIAASAVVSLVVGFGLGYIRRKRKAESVIGSAEAQAKKILEDGINHKEFSNKQIYSTNEIQIGKWVDGKTIYRKVFSVTTPSSPNSSTIATIPNLDTLVKFDGFFVAGDVQIMPINFYINSTYNIVTYIYDNEVQCNPSSYQNLPGVLIVEYTKTTD